MESKSLWSSSGETVVETALNKKESSPFETVDTKTEINPAPDVKQVAVVQDIPFSEATEQKTEAIVSPVAKQVAAIQEASFAETAPNQNGAQETNAIKNRSVLSGTADDLWKIAKIKDNRPTAANVKKQTEPEPAPEMKAEKEITTATAQTAKPEMIYRNGKAVATIQQPTEKKSLNWLDRQQAAVWTSMSQSDTPSVWSTAMETKPEDHEKAKAFRVAEEIPANTEKKDGVSDKVIHV